jgi:hypothetical protein
VRTLIAILGTVCIGCSGGDGGAGGGGSVSDAQNKDADGLYGFEGDGWTLDQNNDGQDIWVGPNGLLLVIGTESELTKSAEVWAKDDYASTELTGAQMTFAPEPLPNGAWWWGWYYGGDTFEGYLVSGSRGINPELQSSDLPKDQAAAIMKTFVIAP